VLCQQNDPIVCILVSSKGWILEEGQCTDAKLTSDNNLMF